MKVINQRAEDGNYRYPLHGDLPNIKTWADVDKERMRIERNRETAAEGFTLSFDRDNELQAHTDTNPKVSVSTLMGHVLSPDTYHAYAIYLHE
jgi:hypothetical protein